MTPGVFKKLLSLSTDVLKGDVLLLPLIYVNKWLAPGCCTSPQHPAKWGWIQNRAAVEYAQGVVEPLFHERECQGDFSDGLFRDGIILSFIYIYKKKIPTVDGFLTIFMI